MVGADPVEHCGQVYGGELPVERPGSLVVPAGEGQRAAANWAVLAKSLGETTFAVPTTEKSPLVFALLIQASRARPA